MEEYEYGNVSNKKGEIAYFVNQPPTNGPLFENKICYCGKKAAVLISECTLTCGKLYYACFNGNCKYYEWWWPTPGPRTENEENEMKNRSKQCLKSVRKQMLASSSVFSFLTVVTMFVAKVFRYQE